MRISSVYYQLHNSNKTQNNILSLQEDYSAVNKNILNNNKLKYPHSTAQNPITQGAATFLGIEKTYNQNGLLVFTGENDKTSWDKVTDKAKNISEKVVNKTKNSFAHIQSLFQTKVELPEDEEAFLNNYLMNEEKINEKYDKKIAEINDDFWDNFFNHSEKKRQKIRKEKEKALKISYLYQDAFEQREKEAIENRKKFYELAKQLNMSKEIIVAFEKSQELSRRRLDIIKRKKEFLDQKGFSQIAGYMSEKDKLSKSFLDLIDDEKAGKYLKKSIPNAILFYGPTGCGKTTFVKALADEADCNLKVIHCRGTQKEKEQQLYDTLVGYTDTDEFGNDVEVSGLLEKAQKSFEKTNRRTIILIDEFDRFFGKDASPKFINTMKGILENCSEDNHVTFFLTSNKPQKIPYELRNSHRIDPTYSIDPPNKENTVAVIEHYLQGCETEDLDYNAILNELFKFAPDEIYSNTHLKVISEIATDEIKPESRPLTTDMFLQAIKQYNDSNSDSNLLRVTKDYLKQYENDKETIG